MNIFFHKLLLMPCIDANFLEKREKTSATVEDVEYDHAHNYSYPSQIRNILIVYFRSNLIMAEVT